GGLQWRLDGPWVRPAAYSDDLGDKPDRELRRGLSAKAEAGRPVEPVALLVAKAVGFKSLVPFGAGVAAAHPTDVHSFAPKRDLHGRVLELWIVCEHDDIRLRPELQLWHHFVRPADDQLVRMREAFPGREHLTRVDHRRPTVELL